MVCRLNRVCLVFYEQMHCKGYIQPLRLTTVHFAVPQLPPAPRMKKFGSILI